MSELKPCHHCESDDVQAAREWRGWFVLCGNCCARGPYETGEERAVSAWNTRATDAELERLRADRNQWKFLAEQLQAMLEISISISEANDAIDEARKE